MDIAKWDDSYSVGLKEIDDQHKRLFDLINKLYNGMTGNETHDQLAEVIHGLIDYTRYHFKTEEEYFARFGYAESASHIATHTAFVDKIKKFEEDFKTGDVTVSMDLLTFLKEWLIKHIKGEDKKYVALFKEHGVK